MSEVDMPYAPRGPWRFRLVRLVDETGISGTGVVAHGARFEDGVCVLRWCARYTSTAIYASAQELEAIHGHGGKTAVEWIDAPPTEASIRGAGDCWQDQCEGVFGASVGGRARLDGTSGEPPRAPDYIAKLGAEYAAEWLRGYVEFATGLLRPIAAPAQEGSGHEPVGGEK